MTSTSNQLPSNKSDTIAKGKSSYYCLPTGHTLTEIKCNQMVVKRENGGNEGSMQFTLNYTVVTEALKPRFGSAKYFVHRSKDGKEAVNGNINYTYFQDFSKAKDKNKLNLFW